MKRFWTAVAILGILASFLLTAISWPSLPGTVPVHFGLNGQVDRYGTHAWLWFPFLFSVGIFALLTAVRRFPQLYNLPVSRSDPRRPAYEAAASEMIGQLAAALTWMGTLLCFAEIQGARGRLGALSLWIFPLALAGTALPIVHFFLKVRELRR